MIKKLQYIEKSGKMIKTEPIDCEIIHPDIRQDHRYQIQLQAPKMAMNASTQKVILSPRVEYVHRSGSAASGSSKHYPPRTPPPLHASATLPGAPQIIITRAAPSPSASSSPSSSQYHHHQHQQQVRVIRDGRMYEESLSPHMPPSQSPSSADKVRHTSTAEDLLHHNSHHSQHLHHSQPHHAAAAAGSSRKYIVTRHVNVISSNGASIAADKVDISMCNNNAPPAATSQQASSSPSSAGNVFRTPVVSSSSSSSATSTSASNVMRPPPPPPPPKIKNTSPLSVVSSCSSSEEPSSSIPDLEFDGTTVLCRVCGDKASGFHYGVHSCEGCKGFFRRSIQQKIQYRPCTKNQQCSILRINRNRCQYCRLKKCIAVGMSRDAVRFGRVPKREKARILAAMQQSTQNRGQQRALATELDDQPRLLAAVLRAHMETCEFTKEKVSSMRQRARECPSYSMPTLLACPLNPAPELQSEQEFSQRFAHVIRGVIDFAGMIPGFQLLTQDDKFTLLKAGLFDALFVRLICMFDSSINSIICLNGQVMRRDAIQNGANARFLVDSTFNFAERMNSMNLSDAEIGLFCAIVLITPDRPGLRNLELIEKMYSRLKACLQSIVNQNRPDQPEFMAKLLDTMPDLRTLSTLHTEKLVVFRTEHKELLRQQMWPMEEDQPSKSPASSWDDARMDDVAKSPLGSVSSTESGDLDYSQQSSLASSAPLLAATLSGGCPLRHRANSGSSGEEIDIVGSHAHLTQNGLTITPIVRTHSQNQLHHHLTSTHRYRKLDSPTDSGIESGNEKAESTKTVSSGGSSSCSSPRSSVDDVLDSDPAQATATTAGVKRQIVEDMPVLKRVLQAPPLYDTNSLMDEAYKPHKKFRALRHREFETAEADATPAPFTCPVQSTQQQHQSHPQSQSQQPPAASPSHHSQLHMHLTRTQFHQPSSLSSTHLVLAKSLKEEPRMTPEQMKRSDIIQNYIMREPPTHTHAHAQPGLLVCASSSPAPHYSTSSPASSSTSSNCSSPSTTTVTLSSPPPPPQMRWQGHSVITTTNLRPQSASPNGAQYFQSPHSTSVSPPRPSPSAHSPHPPRLIELKVDIADSQQPLNLSKKSPTPPPSKLHKYPTVAADVTVTPAPPSVVNQQVHKVKLEA